MQELTIQNYILISGDLHRNINNSQLTTIINNIPRIETIGYNRKQFWSFKQLFYKGFFFF